MALFAKDSPANAPDGAASEPRTRSVSVLSSSVAFEGTVTGTDKLLIEGSFKGKIDIRSELRVTGSARVEATVHAQTVIVEGNVIGDVSADGKIELLSTARVDGNIKAPKIVVAEGATFRGSVDMGAEKPGE